MHLKGYILYHLKILLVIDVQMLYVEDRLTRFRGFFFCLKIHFTAYHFVCHDFGGCGCHVHNIHQTSAVQDRASVCNTFDLFQFMCD